MDPHIWDKIHSKLAHWTSCWWSQHKNLGGKLLWPHTGGRWERQDIIPRSSTLVRLPSWLPELQTRSPDNDTAEQTDAKLRTPLTALSVPGVRRHPRIVRAIVFPRRPADAHRALHEGRALALPERPSHDLQQLPHALHVSVLIQHPLPGGLGDS